MLLGSRESVGQEYINGPITQNKAYLNSFFGSVTVGQ